jgi:sulfur-carrier protein
MPTIRLELPLHLRRLANISGHETTLDIPEPVTLQAVLNALEANYPQLRGTIRDHVTLERRAFLRFFANMEDITHQPSNIPLPTTILERKEPLIILGAIAGG